GEGQDLGGSRALLRDEPRDPAGEDGRLAGSGAGHDEQRPVAVGHRLALARRQVREKRGLQPKVGANRSGRWSGELLEDGELVRRRDDRWHELDGRRESIHPAVIGDLSDTYPVAFASAR